MVIKKRISMHNSFSTQRLIVNFIGGDGGKSVTLETVWKWDMVLGRKMIVS